MSGNRNWNTEKLKTIPDRTAQTVRAPWRIHTSTKFSRWHKKWLSMGTLDIGSLRPLRNELQNKLYGFQMGLGSKKHLLILKWFIYCHMFMFAPQNQTFRIHVSCLYIHTRGFPKSFLKWGYPQINLFIGIFPYKPTIWGYPHFWKHPRSIRAWTARYAEKMGKSRKLRVVNDEQIQYVDHWTI